MAARVVSLVNLWCSLAVIAAPPVHGSARADRQSATSRLVTGEAAHLASFVDGGAAGGGVAAGTYYIRMEPVQPLDGSSYGGNCSIAGNTITCLHGPQRLWFDIYMGGWAPYKLTTYQIGMSYAVLSSGAGAPLVFEHIPCAGLSAGTATCVAAFGPGSECRNLSYTECNFAFQDSSRPDYHGFAIALTNNNDPIRWGGTGLGQVLADPGTDVYAGSLAVDAQAGSLGTYTLELLKNGNTFFTLEDGSRLDLGLFTITPAVVDFQTTHCCILPANGCADVTTQGECDQLGGAFVDDADGDLCTVGVCNANGGCDNLLRFNPVTQCCNGSTGDTSPLDDGDPCTEGSCDESGAIGDRDAATAGLAVYTSAPSGTPCNDRDADQCTAGACDGAGQCEAHLTFDATTECCDGSTYQLTLLDDGNPCTQDSCSGGWVGNRDPATAGTAIHVLLATGVLCDNGDGDLCTAGTCNQYGVCADSTITFDAATECCNGDTGEVTVRDDGDVCTLDACDGSGAVGARDASTAGLAVHTDVAPGTPCATPDRCTIGAFSEGCVCKVTGLTFDPATECCNGTTGVITERDDSRDCTTDWCDGMGLVGDRDPATAGQAQHTPQPADTPCDESDLCTTGLCNGSGFCAKTLLFNAATECCNGTTGVTTQLDDGQPCTVDTCDGSGTVGERDPSTAGAAIHTPAAAGGPCDVMDLCTTGVCDESGRCSVTLTYYPATECCHGTTGVITELDDGNDCTNRICNGYGYVGFRDPATAGTAVYTTPEPDETPCRNGDGDLCTIGACNGSGYCAGSMLTFDPATECCDGDTGATTPLDDGDACTADACDGSGAVGGRDAATAGTAVHEGMPASPADLNQNCSVDLVDYNLMVGCLEGPDAGMPTLICPSGLRAAADLDGDNDIDLADVADLFTMLTIP